MTASTRAPFTRSLVLAVAAAALLTGCAPTVPVEVAPEAQDPLCAEVLLALPDELEGMARLRTSSQGTRAWGDRSDPVVLRCGVEPPPPTTEQCVTADDGTTAVDWIAVPDDPDAEASRWTFTTYGRRPAVEVVVPAAVTSVRSTSFLLDLGPGVSQIEATRHCL